MSGEGRRCVYVCRQRIRMSQKDICHFFRMFQIHCFIVVIVLFYRSYFILAFLYRIRYICHDTLRGCEWVCVHGYGTYSLQTAFSWFVEYQSEQTNKVTMFCIMYLLLCVCDTQILQNYRYFNRNFHIICIPRVFFQSLSYCHAAACLHISVSLSLSRVLSLILLPLVTWSTFAFLKHTTPYTYCIHSTPDKYNLFTYYFSASSSFFSSFISFFCCINYNKCIRIFVLEAVTVAAAMLVATTVDCFCCCCL